MKRKYATQLDWALARPKLTMLIAALIFGATLLLVPFIGGEFMPHLDEGALWVRATMPYTISFEEASSIAPQIRAILMSYPASHCGRLRVGTARRRNRPHRLFQLRVLCRPEALQGQGLERRHQHQGQADRSDQPEAERVPRHRLQLYPACGRCRGRGPDRIEEFAGGQNLWRRLERAPGQSHSDQERAGQSAGIHRP